MKKIISILLCLAMLFGLCTSVFADGYSTEVTYTGTGAESYTVTVPASMQPNESKDVYVEGTWPSTKTLNVTADDKVTLTNSINSADTKELAVTFEGISLAGDNEKQITQNTTGAKKQVSVAAISGALFGTWTGTFNYQVELAEETVFSGINVQFENHICGTVDYYYSLDNGDSWTKVTSFPGELENVTQIKLKMIRTKRAVSSGSQDNIAYRWSTEPYTGIGNLDQSRILARQSIKDEAVYTNNITFTSEDSGKTMIIQLETEGDD